VPLLLPPHRGCAAASHARVLLGTVPAGGQYGGSGCKCTTLHGARTPAVRRAASQCSGRARRGWQRRRAPQRAAGRDASNKPVPRYGTGLCEYRRAARARVARCADHPPSDVTLFRLGLLVFKSAHWLAGLRLLAGKKALQPPCNQKRQTVQEPPWPVACRA